MATGNPAGIKNTSPAVDIERLVWNAFNEGKDTVRIPEGKYYIPSGGNESHLLFRNLEREDSLPFTIDAAGVEIVCRDHTIPALRFENCRNVIFQGAVIGYGRPAVTQGEVTGISDDGLYIEVLLDEGYPPIDSREPTAYVYRKDTLQMKNDCPDMYANSCEDSGNRRYRIGYGFDVRKVNLAPGDILGFRTSGNINTQLLDCEKVSIRNCTITDGELALFENGGKGGNTYDGVIVAPGRKPDGAARERVLSTHADALHSCEVRNGPVVKNCRFEGMGDDCINIHGIFAMLMEKTGAAEYIVGKPSYGTSFGYTGDRVRINDEKGTLLADVRILAIDECTGYRIPGGLEAVHKVNSRFTPVKFQRVLLSEDPELPFGAIFTNTDNCGRGFRIINNTFGPNRGRGVLIKADDGVIERNTFTGQSIHSVLVSPEFSYWIEVGYVHNLLIRDNVFKAAGFVHGYQPAVLIGGEGGKEGGISHRNIIIENNIFDGNYGDSLSIRYADGTVVRGNRFLERNEAAKRTRGGLAHIKVEDSRGVEIYGNTCHGDMITIIDGGNTQYKRLA